VVVDACRVPVSAVVAGDTEVARAIGNEMARVVGVLEADEVRVEEALEEIVVDRDGAEDLGGGEQRVEEESNAGGSTQRW
jgi:hypothetical protein